MVGTMTGKVHKLGNLEAWADGGSVVVLDHKTHTRKRVSVPDWQELTDKEHINYVFCSRLTEWLGGEGWDTVPEEIRNDLKMLSF